MKRFFIGLVLILGFNTAFANNGVCTLPNVKAEVTSQVAKTWWVEGFNLDGYDKYKIDSTQYVEYNKHTGKTACYSRVLFSSNKYNDRPAFGMMYLVTGSKADIAKGDFDVKLATVMPYDLADW